MKKKIDFKIILIIILVIVLIGIIYIYSSDFTITSDTSVESKEDTTTLTATAQKMTISNTIASSAEITSSLTEELETHTTYYLSEVLVETNQQIEIGQNILKYTNGTYMTAPYDCIITQLNLPEVGGKCENSHYVTILSTDTLTMTVSIDEDEINKISIGQEAQITVDVNSDNKYTGYVTNISNTASNGKFEVKVQFQNDDNIKIGMSGTCEIILEKAVDVIVVPSEAVSTSQGKSYVTIQNNGNTNSIQVETGISNDAYTEIKSGLGEGDIIQYEKSQTSNNSGNMRRNINQGQMNNQFEEGMNQKIQGDGTGTPPEIPSDK